MKGTGFRFAGAFALVTCLSGCATELSATRDDDRGTLARLLRHGANANEASPNGTTPLSVAVEANNMPVARMLLDAGADVNKTSMCRGLAVTPLQKAALHGNVAMLRFLLERGADPMAPSPSNTFVLLAFDDRDPRDVRAITDAIVENVRSTKGDDAVRPFLDARQGNGWTALAAAAWRNDIALIDALLAHGASVDAQAGAGNVDAINDDWPPLLFAMVRENQSAIERLLKAGADPSAKTSLGKTGAEVIAEREQRRAEAAERRRQERLEEEEQSRRNFAAFQQGMQTVAAGIQAGIDEANETRRKQQEALDNLRRSREERATREAEAAREAQAENRRQQTTRSEAERPSSGSSRGSSSSSTSGSTSGGAVTGAVTGAASAAGADDTKKADEDAKKKAEAEAAKKEAWDNYLASLRQGMRARATTGYPTCASSPKEYCVVAHWPSGVRAPDRGANLVDVEFRARCRGSGEPWQSGRLDHVSPPPASVVPAYLQPKPNCSVSDVEVEVTDVSPSR